eukprot:XP_782349.2 PREDICTED: uncharacterized protein LOC576996 isoform X1 [Strongylocentrotus purpuratus]
MYPAGGPPRHNQGYHVLYANQVNPGQCMPGPLVSTAGTMHPAVQHSLLGPPPLLQPNFAPAPLMVPMSQSSFLPSQPQPQYLSKAVSPSRAPHHTDNQGQVVQQENFRRGGFRGGYGSSGQFSTPRLPPRSTDGGGFASQGSTPSAPPPLFRPGPHTSSSKGRTTEDQKQLNPTEKEDLYRMFGVVLQQHGPIEVTDSRLLSIFMGLSPWMRQGIKYLGGLKDFFRHGDIFKVDGDVVSLAWQEEEAEDKPNQSKTSRTSPMASKPKSSSPFNPKSSPFTPKSPSPFKPKSPSPIGTQTVDTDDKSKSKDAPKDRNVQSSTESDNKDPEEIEKKLLSISPSTIGSTTEEEKNKSPVNNNKEIQKKLVFTSTPSLGSTTEDEQKTSLLRNDSPTPWNWEESAIAQEAEAQLRRESELTQDRQQSGQSPQTLGGESGKNDARSWPLDAEGSTGGRSLGEKSDGSVQEEEGDRRSPEMIYRSGSLHQAEGDVIVLEDIEVSGTEEEEGEVIGGTDSAEEKSDVFTDALEDGQEDADTVGEGMRVKDDHQGSSPFTSINGIALREVEEQRPESCMEEDMMSDMISKLINVAVSEVTKSQPRSTTDQETDQNNPSSSQDSQRADEESVSVSSTEIGLSKSVRSIGVETPKPQQSHKAMCTKEIKTTSRKVNTPSVSTSNRRVGTGEDPRIEQLTSDLEKEKRRRRHLADDAEGLYDKLDMRKKEYASETEELKRKLDRTAKELADCQRKLSGKGIVQLGELRKTNMELKDSESRLNAAKSKIARAEKENSNLTNELEKTTRQLLDLEKSQAQKEASGRTRSTSTGGLEPEKDPAIEEENKLLKMRSRSAEQKVLELQYQYAMQSLNKALQESQYIFRMYGNSLLSSSHRELLRMKWSDYQMYIKEKTDEVATSYYSSLKHLHQDVPLADIPSLKTQHIETFNPYKQSPVKAGEFGYISPAVTGLAAPPQTLPDPSMPPVVPLGVMSDGEGHPSFPLNATAVNTGLAPTSGSTKAPPGLAGATAQAPPGLTKVAVGSDLGMPFMQAQTQRGAPGKVLRRVPHKAPKALLAANFMSSLQHTTKVYGSTAAAAPPTQPQVGMMTGGRGVGVGGGTQSQGNVHDWLDNMDIDNVQNQASAPTSNIQHAQAAQDFREPHVPTPMDTTSTQPQPEGMDTQTTSLPDQVMMAPPMGAGGMTRPAGIGRGRPLSAAGMSSQPPAFPSMKSQRVAVEAMDVGMRPKAAETLDLAPRLGDTTTSRTSSSSNSRSGSPFYSQLAGAMERLARPPGSKQSSPFKSGSQVAGAIERLSGSKRGSPAGAVAGSESLTKDSKASRPRPTSAGDAMFASQANTDAAKARSVSLGGGTLQSSSGPATSQEPSQQKPSARNFQAAPNFKEAGSHGDSMANVPRSRARQLRMPYHRGAEEEQDTGASKEGGGDKWTTQVSKRKRKVLNLAEQQTQLIKEHRHLTGSCVTKSSEPSKGQGRPQKQGSLDKLVSYLSKQFKQMSRKELTDSILQVRLDHNGSLSGIALGTIISEASSYLSRAEKKKNRKDSEIVGMCAVCQGELYGDPDERKLDCGHKFHSKCIKTWVNEEGTCPICRRHTLFPEDFPRLQ